MRKEFVYSVMALGAIPVTVNATVNAYQATDVQIIASATGISIPVNALAKGNYTLKSEAISAKTGIPLTVKINGVDKGQFLNGESINVDINQDAAGDLTILLEGINGESISVPGLVLQLNFDFQTLYANLQKENNHLYDELNSYNYEDLAQDIANTYSAYQVDILKIKTAGETDGTEGYKVYKELELFNYTTTTGPLFDKIAAARTNSKGKEKTYQQGTIFGTGSDFEKAKADHAALPTYLKTTALSDLQTAAQAAYDAIDGSQEKTQAAQTAIKAYIDAVNAAKQSASDNIDAYTALKKQIDDVITYKNNAKANLFNASDPLGSLMVHDATYGDIYADLRTDNATNDFDAAETQVTTAATSVETANTNGSAKSKKSDLEKEIADAKQAVTDVVTEYNAYKATIYQAYDTLKDKVKALADVLTPEVDALTDATVVADKATAQTKINDLLTFIQANDTKSNIGNLEDLSAYTTAIDEAIEALKASAKPALATQKAYNDMKATANGQSTALDEAKATVATYANTEKKLPIGTYDTATLWKETTNDISAKIADVLTNIETNKADATNYQKNEEYTDAIAKIKEDISAFVTNAKAAVDIYAKVNADVATAEAEITTVTSLASGKDIWTEKVKDNDRTAYKDVIATLTSKKDEVKTKLATSLTKTSDKDITKEDNHLGYLNKNVPSNSLEDVLATLKSMKENINADQKAYEAQRDAQAIQNMKDNIKAQADDYNARIAKLEKNVTDDLYGPLGTKVTEALVPIKAYIDDALAKDGTATELITVLNDLKALDLDDVVGNDLDALETAAAGYATQGAAYKVIMTAINAIDIADIVAKTKEKDPDNTYYTGRLTGYYTDQVNALIKKVKEETTDWVADKATLLGNVSTLKTEIEGVPALAEANLAEYNNQKTAYDDAVTAYNTAKTKMADYPSSELEAQLAALDAYKDKFDDLKEKADTEYQEGKSATNGITTSINSLVADMNNDVKKWTDEVNYNAQIAKDNKQIYTVDIPAAKKSATDVYQEVSDAINRYKTLKSTEMKAAANVADAELATLNELLLNYNEELAKIQKAADDAYKATISPDKYDEDRTFEAQFKAKADEVIAAKDAFLNAIKAAINTSVQSSIGTYTAAIKASKEKAANFSATDDPANVTTAYNTVDGMLADIKDAFEAEELEVATLDDALSKAENETTGINSEIVKAEQTLAQNALQTLIDELEGGSPALKSYLTTSQIAELDADKADKANATKAVSNFDTLKASLKALIAAAKDAKENSLAIASATAVLKATKTDLNNAYTTIDGYAGGATVKPTLDNVQAQIDAVGTITVQNADEAKTLAAELQKTIAKAITADLYAAELAAVNDLLKQAKEEYVPYAAYNDGTAIKARLTKAENTDIPAAKAKAEAETPDYNGALTALKAIETTLTNDLNTMWASNGTVDNATIAADLQKQLNDLQTEADGVLPPYSAAIKTALADDKTAIDDAITAAKTYITANAANMAVFKANAEAKITDVKAQINALKAKAEELKAKADAENEAAAQATLASTWTEAQSAVNAAKAAVSNAKSELAAYEATSSYANKIAQLENLAAAAQTDLDNVKAKAETKESTAEKQTIANEALTSANKTKTSVTTDSNEILGKAKNAYVSKITDALKNQVNAINIVASNYTSADATDLTNIQNDIKTAINALDSNAKAQGTSEDVISLLNDGQSTPVEVKSQAEIELMIADLKAEMKKRSLIEDNSELRGHVSGSDASEEITSDDLLDLVDIILNNQESTADLDRCDIDGNGEIDVTDLVYLRYYMVHGEWPTPADLSARAKTSAVATMEVQTVSTFNGITRVAVNLESNKTYQAMQLDIQLPAGAILRDKSLGERFESASLLSSDTNSSSIRIIAIATRNSVISGTDGAVLYLDIENLNGEVGISNVTLTDTSFRSNVLGTNTTAIETIRNMVETTGQTIYNIGGKVMNGLKKGINIIRNADGSSKKVIVK